MKKELRHCLKSIANMQEDGYTVWPASLAGCGKSSLKDIKEMLGELEEKNYLSEDDKGVIHITDKGKHTVEIMTKVAVS